MKRIALLIAANIASDAPNRRADAAHYEMELDLLDAACRRLGMTVEPVKWADGDLSGFAAALALCAWDYQDQSEFFLRRLAGIASGGVPVFNNPGLVRWNIRKTYLQELEARGVAIIPTLWPDNPAGEDLQSAFETFGADEIVLKRQVGAGARSQEKYSRATAPKTGGVLPWPGMIQPLVPSVINEGEYSFLFVDGAFSHALVKRAKAGDYRIQAAYGGVSHTVEPGADDLRQARAVLDALDAPPLYARIDMVRDASGRLMLMELEAIEPFLFPEQGPQVMDMIAAGLRKRLDK